MAAARVAHAKRHFDDLAGWRRLAIIGGVEGVAALADFGAVGGAVAVGVGVFGGGAVDVFLEVGEAVIVRIALLSVGACGVERIKPVVELPAVGQTVAIGVPVVRVRADSLFKFIREAVVV